MSDWLGWMDLSQNITPPRAPCGANNSYNKLGNYKRGHFL